MVSEWELWGCAQQVLQQHGERAPAHVAERIGAMAVAGDEEGIRTWKRVAECIDQLTDYRGAWPKTRH